MPAFIARLTASLGLVIASFTLTASLAGSALSQDAPPRADQYEHLTDFLACTGNPYALCYYSGPEEPTPPGQSQTPPLPCSIDGPLRADCTCYAIADGPVLDVLHYNFVLVDSILNPSAREATIAQCGEDGRGCLNMAYLATGYCDPDDPAIAEKAECQAAPVCSQLGDLESGTGQTLYDDPEVELISTFSFAYSQIHDFGSHSCAANNIRLYAGCMTAPCGEAGEDGLTQCSCPLYDGEYQVGQDHEGLQCNILPNVWSAADNAIEMPLSPPGRLAGGEQ